MLLSWGLSCLLVGIGDILEEVEDDYFILVMMGFGGIEVLLVDIDFSYWDDC